MVGGALNVTAARFLNWGHRTPPLEPLGLDAYRALASPGPLDLVRLLAGRPNAHRARVLEAALSARGAAVTQARYRTIEGAGVNLFAEVGGPGPVLLLAAHHDAVPGSPGANDNAAGVGVLVALWSRLRADPPRRLTVRLGFFGGEERAMLGSRAYARRAAIGDLLGVVSLELCGIGDALALWDVTPALEARLGASSSSTVGRPAASGTVSRTRRSIRALEFRRTTSTAPLAVIVAQVRSPDARLGVARTSRAPHAVARAKRSIP